MAKKIAARISEIEAAFLEAVKKATERWRNTFSVPEGILRVFVDAVKAHANGKDGAEHVAAVERLIGEVEEHQRRFFLGCLERLRNFVKTGQPYDADRQSTIDRLLGTLEQYGTKDGAEKRFFDNLNLAVETFLEARDTIEPLIEEQKRLNRQRKIEEARRWREARLSDAASYATVLGISLETTAAGRQPIIVEQPVA